jgi:hypothetical protein
VSYDVRVAPDVDQDVVDLVSIDAKAAREALRLILALRDDPWLGDDPRERYHLLPLRDCRRLRFDWPGWPEKPRFRIVYRNEPSDGAPEVVRVWAVGPRDGLIAYGRAAARITRERSREARRWRR